MLLRHMSKHDQTFCVENQFRAGLKADIHGGVRMPRTSSWAATTFVHTPLLQKPPAEHLRARSRPPGFTSVIRESVPTDSRIRHGNYRIVYQYIFHIRL